jgi:hypothetical protein
MMMSITNAATAAAAGGWMKIHHHTFIRSMTFLTTSPCFLQRRRQRPSKALSSLAGSNTTKSINNRDQIMGTTFCRSFSSSADKNNNTTTSPNDGLKRTVYVHPLSQIILEYLQDCRHEWIVEQGLQSLTLHRDGSFELKYRPGNRNTSPSNEQAQQNEDHDSTTATTVVDRIWTSYDEEEKKHWLTVQKSSLHQRFLLQDNLLPAWHGNRNKSLPERIHLSVDNMIRAVDRLDIQQ